ncbi:MAG: hypothetical protein WKF30_19345 [Pyrinomonadaceae bacterium]
MPITAAHVIDAGIRSRVDASTSIERPSAISRQDGQGAGPSTRRASQGSANQALRLAAGAVEQPTPRAREKIRAAMRSCSMALRSVRVMFVPSPL